MFNASRFELARKRRGITQKELAYKIGISERSISLYEKGNQQPEQKTLQKIAQELGFPEIFFLGENIEKLSPEKVSFRASTKMSAKLRDMALNTGIIAFMLNEWIEEHFDIPSPNIPDLRGEMPPEHAADILRSQWKLGEQPIKNIIALLELKGVRVFSLAIDAKEVDAFSTWHNGKPFIFLNTYKSAERCRFDATHELGHLVLHSSGKAQGIEIEREADAFASAFLMPQRAVLANAPHVITLQNLIDYKSYWMVSIAALNYRLHQLNLTSDWIYRTLCIQMSELGYRTHEPEPITHETSQVLKKIFDALWKEGISKMNIAKELGLDPNEIEDLTFGRLNSVLNQTSNRPALRVIK
jgi:Zn-dependent peptidase ImmA (M78 family)/DNA-binding XRE family transcriptional regulator